MWIQRGGCELKFMSEKSLGQFEKKGVSEKRVIRKIYGGYASNIPSAMGPVLGKGRVGGTLGQNGMVTDSRKKGGARLISPH